MSPTAGERLLTEPSPVSVALAAEVKRRKTHARSEAMLTRFGLGPEGCTCGECYFFGVVANYPGAACNGDILPQRGWKHSWPACAKWRDWQR